VSVHEQRSSCARRSGKVTVSNRAEGVYKSKDYKGNQPPHNEEHHHVLSGPVRKLVSSEELNKSDDEGNDSSSDSIAGGTSAASIALAPASKDDYNRSYHQNSHLEAEVLELANGFANLGDVVGKNLEDGDEAQPGCKVAISRDLEGTFKGGDVRNDDPPHKKEHHKSKTKLVGEVAAPLKEQEPGSYNQRDDACEEMHTTLVSFYSCLCIPPTPYCASNTPGPSQAVSNNSASHIYFPPPSLSPISS